MNFKSYFIGQRLYVLGYSNLFSLSVELVAHDTVAKITKHILFIHCFYQLQRSQHWEYFTTALKDIFSQNWS